MNNFINLAAIGILVLSGATAANAGHAGSRPGGSSVPHTAQAQTGQPVTFIKNVHFTDSHGVITGSTVTVTRVVNGVPVSTATNAVSRAN